MSNGCSLLLEPKEGKCDDFLVRRIEEYRKI
jgi:hypothetical protein